MSNQTPTATASPPAGPPTTAPPRQSTLLCSSVHYGTITNVQMHYLLPMVGSSSNKTSCQSNGSDSLHRRGKTSLLRAMVATGRLKASGVQGMPHSSPLKCTFPLGDPRPHLIYSSLSPSLPPPIQTASDQFIRFGRAYRCAQHTQMDREPLGL